MKELLQRSISGIVFVLAIFLLLWLDELTLLLFCILLNVFGLNEFYRLAWKIKFLPYIIIGIVGGTLGISLAYMAASGIIPLPFVLFAFLIFPLFSLPVLLYHPPIFFKSWAITFSGLLYISLPLALVPFIAFREGEYRFEILLAVFILIWLYDSFAYLVGTMVGKNRIYPALSPKKSWEGAVGGLVFTLAGTILLYRLFGVLSLEQWVVLAVIVVITGTFGDFIESALKRNAGVKDSGKFLPGHGGFLDRFDSFLFSIPFVFVYLYILKF